MALFFFFFPVTRSQWNLLCRYFVSTALVI